MPHSRSRDHLVEHFKFRYEKFDNAYERRRMFFVPPRDAYFNLYTRGTCNDVTDAALKPYGHGSGSTGSSGAGGG